MWYTRSEVMRKCILHLAHIFCAGRVNAASEVGNRAAVRLAAAGKIGTEVVAAGNEGVNGKPLIGKPAYGIGTFSAWWY